MNHNHHLGVNRTGKNIRKSPIHQSNFQQHPPPQNRQQQQQQQQQQNQPQVYNISKNDFRDVVQQLTGTPSRDPSPNPPPPLPQPSSAVRPPKAASLRLQKIRPPPLTPIARPNIPNHDNRPNNFHYNSNQNPAALHHRPPSPQPQPQQGTTSAFPPTPPSLWAGVAESPVSVYMRYLENSVLNPDLSMPAQLGRGPPPHPQPPQHPHPHPPQHPQPPQHPRPGLMQHPPQIQISQLGPQPPQPPYSGPGFNSPRGPPVPAPLPPVSPSPNAFMNLLSPRSPYSPLLSPGFQFPPPLSPTFFLSPLSQHPGSGGGLLGPGPQTPHSPGLFFPPSPSWYVPSPKWGDMP